MYEVNSINPHDFLAVIVELLLSLLHVGRLFSSTKYTVR